MILRLLLICFVALVGFTSYSQDDKSIQLQAELLKVAEKLGLNKSHVAAYFDNENNKRLVCRDTTDSTIQRLHTTNQVYPGRQSWFYAEHGIGELPSHCYLLIERTPHNSFRSRLNRLGFEQKKGSKHDYLVFERDNLRVESISFPPIVMDIYSYVSSCGEIDLDRLKNTYHVVVFSLLPSD